MGLLIKYLNHIVTREGFGRKATETVSAAVRAQPRRGVRALLERVAKEPEIYFFF